MAKATDVFQAAAVCDPDLALSTGHEWYVDLSAYRGGNVAQQILRSIKSRDAAAAIGLIARSDAYAKLLLTGLRGSGKTTELNQLAGLLQTEGYVPIHISGVRELNLEQLTHTELLMSLIWALQDLAQEASPPGPYRLHIRSGADDDLNLAIAEVLFEAKDKASAEVKLESEFGLKAEIPFFVRVQAALKSVLASSSEESRTVKARIFQRTRGFLDALNGILDEVQDDLRAQGSKGLVFVVDELDRIPPRMAEGFPDLTIAEFLFDLQSADLKAPRAHVVYTFPSQLLVKLNLGRSWAERPLIIPAVRIHERSGEPTPARAVLRDLVAARVDLAQVFVRPDDLMGLVDFSGGYARDVLRLVRLAANRTDTRIGPDEILMARRSLVSQYSFLVPPALLPRLADVDRAKALPPSPEYSELLERNLVLTYWNDEEWADLHPAARETAAYSAYVPGPSSTG